MFPVVVISSLIAASMILMFLERRGLPTTLMLDMKGDLKRETRLLAQYGQLTCTFIVALLIWQVDVARGFQIDKALWSAVIGTTLVATALKRILGRVRPGREPAGKFVGFSIHHANWRESFPSSHSASAVAFSVVLASAYPGGASTFWVLAIICAVLRYLMDAHWPSDVLSGIALGYLGGLVSWRIFF